MIVIVTKTDRHTIFVAVIITKDKEVSTIKKEMDFKLPILNLNWICFGLYY